MLKCWHALTGVDQSCGLFAVADAEDSVGGAQVLFDRGFGEEEVFGDLGIAVSPGDELQYLALANGERVEVGGLLVGYEVLEDLSGNDDLASGGDLRGAGYLVQLHSGVDEAPGTEPQGRSGERQIQVQTEDENGDLGADLVDEPYALREVLHPARIEDGAHRYDAPRRGGSPEMHPEDPP